MVRLSKQIRDRSVSFKRPRKPSVKNGPQKDALEAGYKPHPNALDGKLAQNAFIPKL